MGYMPREDRFRQFWKPASSRASGSAFSAHTHISREPFEANELPQLREESGLWQATRNTTARHDSVARRSRHVSQGVWMGNGETLPKPSATTHLYVVKVHHLCLRHHPVTVGVQMRQRDHSLPPHNPARTVRCGWVRQ